MSPLVSILNGSHKDFRKFPNSHILTDRLLHLIQRRCLKRKRSICYRQNAAEEEVTWQSSAFILELKWLDLFNANTGTPWLLTYLDLPLTFFYLQWSLSQEIWVKRQISAVEVSEAACSLWQRIVAPQWAAVPLCSQLLLLSVTSPRPGAPIYPSPGPFLERNGVWRLQRAFSGKEGVGSCNSGSLWLPGTVRSCLQMGAPHELGGKGLQDRGSLYQRSTCADIKLIQVNSSRFHGWGGVARRPFNFRWKHRAP